VVSSLVVMVADALAGGVTVVGLTVQTGGSVVGSVDVTWQLIFTAPLKPLPLTVMLEDDVPPGTTASGDSAPAFSVKLCPAAGSGKANKPVSKHTAATAYRVRRANQNREAQKFETRNFTGMNFAELNLADTDFGDMVCDKFDCDNFDSNDRDSDAANCDASDCEHSDCDRSDFNMSRFRFN
jgi:hypothetical protein